MIAEWANFAGHRRRQKLNIMKSTNSVHLMSLSGIGAFWGGSGSGGKMVQFPNPPAAIQSIPG